MESSHTIYAPNLNTAVLFPISHRHILIVDFRLSPISSLNWITYSIYIRFSLKSCFPGNFLRLVLAGIIPKTCFVNISIIVHSFPTGFWNRWFNNGFVMPQSTRIHLHRNNSAHSIGILITILCTCFYEQFLNHNLYGLILSHSRWVPWFFGALHRITFYIPNNYVPEWMDTTPPKKHLLCEILLVERKTNL